jgi:hypothetical protein
MTTETQALYPQENFVIEEIAQLFSHVADFRSFWVQFSQMRSPVCTGIGKTIRDVILDGFRRYFGNGRSPIHTTNIFLKALLHQPEAVIGQIPVELSRDQSTPQSGDGR